MDLHAIANTATTVVAVVAALSALGLAARWLSQALRSAGASAGLAETSALARIEAALQELKTDTAASLRGLDMAMQAVDHRLVAVEYQVAPNGGGSMRDKVVKTVTLLEAHLNQHNH